MKLTLIETCSGPFSPRRHPENKGVALRYYENNSFPQHNCYIPEDGTNKDKFEIQDDGFLYVFEGHEFDYGYFVTIYKMED